MKIAFFSIFLLLAWGPPWVYGQDCQNYQNSFRELQTQIFELPSQLEGGPASLLRMQREFDLVAAEYSLFSGLATHYDVVQEILSTLGENFTPEFQKGRDSALDVEAKIEARLKEQGFVIDEGNREAVGLFISAYTQAYFSPKTGKWREGRLKQGERPEEARRQQLYGRMQALDEAIGAVKKTDRFRELSHFKDYTVSQMRSHCQEKDLQAFASQLCQEDYTPMGGSKFLPFGKDFIRLMKESNDYHLLTRLDKFCDEQYKNVGEEEYVKRYANHCALVKADLKKTAKPADRSSGVWQGKVVRTKKGPTSESTFYYGRYGKRRGDRPKSIYKKAPPYAPVLYEGSKFLARLGTWYGGYAEDLFKIKTEGQFAFLGLRWSVLPADNPCANWANKATCDAIAHSNYELRERFSDPAFYNRVVMGNMPGNPTGSVGFGL